MVRSRAVVCALLLGMTVVAPAAGCAKPLEHPPHAPRSEGNPAVSFAGEDAGSTGTVDGGGPALGSSGARPTCVEGSEARASNPVHVVVGGTSQPFDTAFAFATWDPRTCAAPMMRVVLSETSCSLAGGHVLTLSLDRAAVLRGELGPGPIYAVADDPRVSVSYLRPQGMEHAGTWGTCRGASGTILIESVGVNANARIRGTFSISLESCAAADGAAPVAELEGSFDVLLTPSLETVCGDGA